MRRISIFILILFMGAVVAGIAGCGGKETGRAKKEETIPVKVMRLELKDLHDALEYVGTIDQDEVTVYPKVSGKIIEKVKEEGSPIGKGDIIAYIDRDEVGLKFEKAPVESPLRGVVGRVYVDIGTNVTTQTPIALVASDVNVDINLSIPEKYLPRISVGQEADITVDAYPDKVFKGRITKVSPIVDIDTRTAPIQITIDDRKHLLQSGMFAKVKLILAEHKDVPVVLKEAIMGKAPDTYLFTAENGRAVLKKVTLGIREGPYFEVTEGVRKGDMVVIMGQQRLKDGVSVHAEE